MISGTVTDMRLVFEDWRTSPLTRSSIDRFVRVADLVGGDDPRAERAEGVDRSCDRQNTPDFISSRWMSRAVMSLKTT